MVEIAQISDLHLDDTLSVECGVDVRNNLITTIKDIQSREISEIVITGDLGRKESLPWLKETLHLSGLRYHIVLGNHDSLIELDNNGLVPIHDIRNDGLYYSIEYDDSQLIFLDSSQALINEKQAIWLKDKLAEAYGLKVIFSHYPILDCGRTAMDQIYPLKNREYIQALLEQNKYKVDIFCGHYHNEHYQTIRNIAQYVTPSLAMQIKMKSNIIELESTKYGYRIIEIDNKKIATEVVMFEDRI